MDNERPIEKLLRAFAKKRRDSAGAPVEMHPATRRLLQGEVARQFKQKGGRESSPKFGFFMRYRAQLLVVTPVLTLCCLVAFLVLYSAKDKGAKSELASIANEQIALPAFAPAPASAAEPPAETVALSGEGDAFKDAAVRFANAETRSAWTNAASATGLSFAWGMAATNGIAANDSTVNRGDEMHGAGQNYSSVAANYGISEVAKDKKSAPPAVLDSFRLEQNGNSLRVIDSDGSVYDGTIVLASLDAVKEVSRYKELDQPAARRYSGEEKSDRQVEEKIMTASNAPQAPGAISGYAGLNAQAAQAANYFNVTGFNNTLKQQVVFCGNLVPASNATQVAQNFSNMAGNKSQNQSNLGAQSSLLQNAAVTGRAKVGAAQEIEINAQPVAP